MGEGDYLALTSKIFCPAVIFSGTRTGPYTAWFHTGGLFRRSTTSNTTLTDAFNGGIPLSEASTLKVYLSRCKREMNAINNYFTYLNDACLHNSDKTLERI